MSELRRRPCTYNMEHILTDGQEDVRLTVPSPNSAHLDGP
jgi:hypothetical protein